MGEVKVKFFASFRESLGREELIIGLEGKKTLDEIIDAIEETAQGLRALLKVGNAVIAVNHEVARGDTQIKAGDEIAIFPPVSGG
ncbi:MAG: molybdopterin converting factor subunit 1 [Candidatus Hydrothermarchaeales archaeon]